MTSYTIGGIIFSNMHENYIHDLTLNRSCGSVPFGGRYRLIDFMLSNMVAGGITSVGVITKSNYKSLMDHLGSGRDWDLARKRGGLVIIPPFALAASGLYHGRMEAIHAAHDFVTYSTADWFVLGDCNYIYNADIPDIVEYHVETGADITCVYQSMHLSDEQLSDCTVFELDADRRITSLRLDPDRPGRYNCALNMMVVGKQFLLDLMAKTKGTGKSHFERDVLQPECGNLRIFGYEHLGTALRIGSMAEYYDANMRLLRADLRHELFNDHPVYTKVRDEMPVRYGLSASTADSLVADGCDIDGSVSGSVLFRGVSIGTGARVKNSILMQGTTVEAGAVIDGVISDKNVVITTGRNLVGCPRNPLFIPKNAVV